MKLKHRFQRRFLRIMRGVGIKQGLEFRVQLADPVTGELRDVAPLHLVQGDTVEFSMDFLGIRHTVIQLEAIDR